MWVGAVMPMRVRQRWRATRATAVSLRREAVRFRSDGVAGDDAAVFVEVMEGGGELQGIVGQVVGFEGVGDFFDYFRQAGSILRMRVSSWGSLRSPERSASSHCQAVLVLGALEDAADAGVGVLDVVDGVFRGLFRGEFEVEVHLGAGSAGEEEIAAGVGAHFLYKFLEGDEVAGALGGLD